MGLKIFQEGTSLEEIDETDSSIKSTNHLDEIFFRLNFIFQLENTSPLIRRGWMRNRVKKE